LEEVKTNIIFMAVEYAQVHGLLLLFVSVLIFKMSTMHSRHGGFSLIGASAEDGKVV